MQQRRHSCTRGYSIVELMIALAIIAVLLKIAIPFFLSAHEGASETVVIREMHTIHEAQLQYLSQYGDFASTLTQLGPPSNGFPGPQAARLIPASLASGEKDGYVFTLAKTAGGFSANANPKNYPKSGRRTFYIDEDGIVHQNSSAEPATVSSPELK